MRLEFPVLFSDITLEPSILCVIFQPALPSPLWTLTIQWHVPAELLKTEHGRWVDDWAGKIHNYRPGASQASVCLFTWGRGRYPSPRFFPWSLVPGPFPWGGYPSPRFFLWSLVPGPLQGVPQSQPGGIPQPQLRLYPSSKQGVPQSQMVGTPSETGVPPNWDWGTPCPRDRRASACYAAGGMPLTVTLEGCSWLLMDLFK